MFSLAAKFISIPRMWWKFVASYLWNSNEPIVLSSERK